MRHVASTVACLFLAFAPTRGYVSQRPRELWVRRPRELFRQVERPRPRPRCDSAASDDSDEYEAEFSVDDLVECDVVEYSLSAAEGGDRGLACVLRDGRLQPLCTWAVDGEEFVWDEELSPVPRSHALAYVEPAPFLSTRLVDGGIGPNNPHGEESEEVYIIDRAAAISDGVVVVHRPDREVWW